MDGDEHDPDGRLHDRVEDLHAHLEATEELPIGREANRWIGEAQAVVGDLVGSGASPSVIVSRVRRVRELLDNVDDTGNPEADDHVATARALADAILDEP